METLDLGPAPAVRVRALSHRYGDAQALVNVDLSFEPGRIIGVIGPDGVGKSTLFSLIAGARKIQTGEVEVLGVDMKNAAARRNILPKIAFMPQGLGKNLYHELSIKENLDFFGRLFGQSKKERDARIDLLVRSTGLAPFVSRPAGKLSGGMKQKLGLCCALIHDPDILILDEPTTGVDPLSRRQFWDLIARLRAARPHMCVLVSTAYMDEAERFDELVAIDNGAVLARGSAQALKDKTAAQSLEQAFVRLSQSNSAAATGPEPLKAQDANALDGDLIIPPLDVSEAEIVIQAEGLTKTFGDFTAVDNVDLEVRRGEIFGFLGPNGCGKSTTMRMLTALLPPSSGRSFVLGEPARADAIEARMRVGFMSQAFSLYTELSVRQNLTLHGRLFRLNEAQTKTRTDELMARFGLEPYADMLAEDIPLGVRQRLSLAVAIIHEPEVLILDEPTSGVDPAARDAFWRELIALSRDSGVTIFLSTHFMNEAARCDRIAFMDAGKLLSTDTPQNLIAEQNASDLEDAFLKILEKSRGDIEAGELSFDALAPEMADSGSLNQGAFVSAQRLSAVAYREAMELIRDPVRLGVAFVGTALLMLVFGFGITLDVEDLTYAALDFDQTPESRAYLEGFSGSRYFVEKPPLSSKDELDQRLRSGDINLSIEIPSGFGRSLLSESKPQVNVVIDGAMPTRARSIIGYVNGLHTGYLEDLSRRVYGETARLSPVDIEYRYRYNQAFESINAIAPSVIAILLVFVPATLTAVGVVRERELGSITNFYVTPMSRLDFLIGKQLPYVAVSMINYFLLVLLAVLVFGVRMKGDFFALTLCALIYVFATTGIGLLVSSFTRSQLAAIIGASVFTITPTIHYAGMIEPVASHEGVGKIIGEVWPTAYFLQASVGTFTKGLGFVELAPFIGALAIAAPSIIFLAFLFMRQQDQ